MDKGIFFISNYNYLTSKESIDVKEISPIIRRRLNLFDKAGISVLNKSYKGNIKSNIEGNVKGNIESNIESLIFSSQFGEIERLIELISQIENYKEVSPNCFSGSIHNYLSGFFTGLIQKNIPYSAVSAGVNSLSMGLVQAIISKYNKVLYCYNDTYNNTSNGINSVSLIVSKIRPEDGFKCKLTKNVECNFKDSEFQRFIDFLDKKKTSFKTALYTIERLD